MSGGSEGETLEYTPTWVVAALCTVIVALSLAAERILHYCGIFLRRKNQKPLYEALQKVKEGLFFSIHAFTFSFRVSTLLRCCIVFA
jgi:mlo protein